MRKREAGSFIKGYSFLFEDEGKEIEAWFSACSGLEKVYVDGGLVCSQRSLSADSSSTFRIGEDEYSVNMRTVSLLKGPFVCTLRKNGRNHKRQRLVFPKLQAGSSKLSFLVRFSLCIVLGVCFGFVWSYLRLPRESVYGFLAVVFVVVFLAVFFYHISIKKDAIPVIEDDDIG